MIRTSLDNAFVHRTLKARYEQRQATPWQGFLDPNQGLTVYSGMVATRSGPETLRLCDGAADSPWGLFALDHNTDIDDLNFMGDLRPFAAYIGGPDAEFEIGAPAFDDTDNWSDPGDGNQKLIYAGTGGDLGKIVSTDPGSGVPVGEFVELINAERIVIRLFSPKS